MVTIPEAADTLREGLSGGVISADDANAALKVLLDAAKRADTHGPYTIELDFDGTKITWSGMWAQDRVFRIVSGEKSLARHREREASGGTEEILGSA